MNRWTASNEFQKQKKNKNNQTFRRKEGRIRFESGHLKQSPKEPLKPRPPTNHAARREEQHNTPSPPSGQIVNKWIRLTLNLNDLINNPFTISYQI